VTVRRLSYLLAVAALVAGLEAAPAAHAGEPFQTDARVRPGDVLVQDAQGRWVPASAAGARSAERPGAVADAQPASFAGPVSARAFARAQGLTYADHGSYAVLEDGTLRVRVYADSRNGLVGHRALQFKQPVVRRGDDLMMPPRIAQLLERETAVERARIASDQAEQRAREAELRARVVETTTSTRGTAVASPTPRPTRPTVKPLPAAAPTTAPRSARALAGWVPPSSAPRRDWQWIVLHHSDDLSGNAAKYDRIHRVDNGWEHGLGYHFVIGNGSLSNDGQVEIGPRWEKQLHGAHAKTPDNRYNDHGVGVCLVGNFDIPGGRPTSAQMESLVRLVRWLMATYNIPADHVRGHCDCCATKCPGENFPWDEFRARLR
jgi:hypothetical protein